MGYINIILLIYIEILHKNWRMLMIYQGFAIVILVIFYAIYIGKIIGQRKKGIQTDQIAKGKKDKKLMIVEILMKIATYSIVVVELISIFMNTSTMPNWIRIVGISFGIIGDTVFGVAVYTMKDSWRAGIPENDKTTIVTDGIYSLSRNPAFLRFDLVYIGILFMFFNWTLLIFTIFSILMLHLQILQEEKFLPTVFGDDYIDYSKRVCRYIGRK